MRTDQCRFLQDGSEDGVSDVMIQSPES